MPAFDLSPYANCPGRSRRCQFVDDAHLAIETGHPLMPVVDIYRCAFCGHGVTRPAMADVAPLYAGRQSDDFLMRDRGWIRALKLLSFRALAKRLLRHLRSDERPCVADFGTGNGMLAACLAEALPSGDIYGLDFFDSAPSEIGAARYLKFDDTEMLKTRVDLLTCFHVLEHDDDPHAFLKRLVGFLKPGGCLAIEVPNVDCVWTGWFGAACANWYAPFHRVHFSRSSLRALLASQGLKIEREDDICGPTIAMSLAGLLRCRPNAWLFAAGIAFRPAQWLAEKVTRRPSALRVVVRNC